MKTGGGWWGRVGSHLGRPTPHHQRYHYPQPKVFSSLTLSLSLHFFFLWGESSTSAAPSRYFDYPTSALISSWVECLVPYEDELIEVMIAHQPHSSLSIYLSTSWWTPPHPSLALRMSVCLCEEVMALLAYRKGCSVRNTHTHTHTYTYIHTNIPERNDTEKNRFGSCIMNFLGKTHY